MVYKPTRHQSLAKSQGRDDPRHIISTAAKAVDTIAVEAAAAAAAATATAKRQRMREPQPVSSKSRTGSVERRLLAFYFNYRPEKLLEVDDILKRYSGREEELFAALVKKYGPEPVGPNYKSRNGKHKRVAKARHDLYSTSSWSDMSPDSEIEVPMRIRLRVPKDDESEVDRDLLEQEEFHSFQLDLATERAFDEMTREMMHNSYSCFFDMFDCGGTRGSESLNEHMVDFLCDRHLAEVETWEDEESLASC